MALARAEAALLGFRPREARESLVPLLRGKPNDLNALVVYVASFLQAGDPEGAAAVLSSRPRTTRSAPVLSLLLVIALAETGRFIEAARWVPFAEREPVVARALHRQPAYEAMCRALGVDLNGT